MSQAKNSNPVGIRLEALRARQSATWGELAGIIGISRSMLDFLKAGTKEPGPKALRKIIAAERAAGIVPPLPTVDEALRIAEAATPADTDFYLTENYRYRMNRMLDEMAEAGGKIVETAKGMKALLAEMQARRAAAVAASNPGKRQAAG